MSSLRRVRRLAGLANRRSNRRSNRLASPRALGATPIRQDLPHHPARAHTNHQRARTLSTPSSARQAWRASAVPRLRRPRWSDRLVARAPARASARVRVGCARPWARARPPPSSPALRAVASTRAAIADGPAAPRPSAPNAFSQADEYRRLVSEGHNLVPLYRRIFDDQLTPILAYRCLVQEDERDAPSFLLESVVGGTQTGRYSFLGSRPYMEVRLRPTPSPRPSRIAPRGTARTRARYLSPRSRTRTRSRDRTIERSIARLGVFDLGVSASSTARQISPRLPRFTPRDESHSPTPPPRPRPLPSPRSPPRSDAGTPSRPRPPGERERTDEADPIVVAGRISERWNPCRTEGLPECFTGGGSTTWATTRSDTSTRGSSRSRRRPRTTASFDLPRPVPRRRRLRPRDETAVRGALRDVTAHDGDAEAALADGEGELSGAGKALQPATAPTLPFGEGVHVADAAPDAADGLDDDQGGVPDAVAATKEHIQAGDVFQLVLSHRFRRRTFADPFDVYRALRVVNPSPYMIYLQARGASSSRPRPRFVPHR